MALQKAKIFISVRDRRAINSELKKIIYIRTRDQHKIKMTSFNNEQNLARKSVNKVYIFKFKRENSTWNFYCSIVSLIILIKFEYNEIMAWYFVF